MLRFKYHVKDHKPLPRFLNSCVLVVCSRPRSHLHRSAHVCRGGEERAHEAVGDAAPRLVQRAQQLVRSPRDDRALEPVEPAQ